MRLVCLMSVAVLTSVVVGAGSPAMQKFVGNWKLISYERTSPAGEISYPRGREPVGRITYDVTGRMSVQIMQPGRPQSDGSVQEQGTPEQTTAAYRGYSAYFGTYAVDETRHVVVHKVEGSLYPNYVGTDQQRHYTFSGNRLTLEAETKGGRSKLVWERLP